jgi:hypothetical protein
MSGKPTNPLIAWIDYGTDGWHPRGFDTEEQLREWILGASSNGSDFVVTRLLDVRITLEERTDS